MLRHRHKGAELPNPLQYFLGLFHNSVALWFRDTYVYIVSSYLNVITFTYSFVKPLEPF